MLGSFKSPQQGLTYFVYFKLGPTKKWLHQKEGFDVMTFRSDALCPMHCLVVAGGNLPPSSLSLPRPSHSADLALTMSVVHYHFSKVTAIAGTPAKKKMAAGWRCIFLLHTHGVYHCH